MAKISASLLLPLLMASLLGVSFSVCRGFKTDRAEFSLPMPCSSSDFCHRMCMLAQEDPPTLAQKSFIHSVEAAATAFLLVSGVEIEGMNPPAAGIPWRLKPVHEHAGAELYLLNATLLV